MKRTKSREERRAAAREVWSELVREQGKSGQSVDAFCRGRDVSASALRYWIAKARATETPLKFVSAVKTGDASSCSSSVTRSAGVLVEVGEARIRVEPGFDRGLLLEVVRAIGGGAR